MNRLLRDERGGVFVISAVVIPVLIVLLALVVDAGTWFTHKRQLQTRADAGALAAGVEYSARWAACGGDATQKAAAETSIDAAARQYAGDPEHVGTLHNTELTEQTRVNVEVNSNAPRAEPSTSWNDATGNGLGPCDPHTTSDAFTDASPDDPVYYTDVGVRERDQVSLFGMFGVDLFRNEAYARVELQTAAAGKGFLPVALPDQDIQQAQLRYYRECGPASGPSRVELLRVPLTPLDSAYQKVSGTTLWGYVDAGGNLTGIDLPKPSDGDCPGTYTPVSAEVRIAGVKAGVIDISGDTYTCAQLAAMQYTDCWPRVSNIAFEDSNPRTEPWFHEVTVTGGASTGQCNADAYFTKLKLSAATTSCTYSVSVTVEWNGLQTSPPAGRHCIVSTGGSTLDRPDCPNGTWSFSGTNSTLGQSNLTVTYSCLEPDPSNPSKEIACPGTTLNTSFPIHSLFLGNRQNTSVLTLVRTSPNPQIPPGGPGAELHYMQNQGQPTVTIYPTVGLEGSLYVGQKRVLRAPHCKNNTNSDNCDTDTSSPNTSQSIDCEPGGGSGGQGHDFVMFANGCRPWYGPNTFDDPVDDEWWPCPPKPSGQSAPWFPNGPGNWRECVVKAPGFSPNVIADGIAAAIGNCSNLQSNSCQSYACTNYNFYDPTKPDEWSLHGGKASPRVVFLFIVPYGAYKGTGSQDTMPILTFAAFYITGWEGKGNGANQNPCLSAPPGPPGSRPDEPTDGGDIVGYFVDYTLPDAPGDPDSHCVIGQLQPCVPVLVR